MKTSRYTETQIVSVRPDRFAAGLRCRIVSTNDSGHQGAGVARRMRRLWTDEEKRSICLQTTAPGISVAQVALRYTINANLIVKWLRDAKYRPASGTGPEEAGSRFLPVEILRQSPVTRSTPVAENHFGIDLAGGHRIRINGGYDPEALARLTRSPAPSGSR